MFVDTKRAYGILFSLISLVSKLTFVMARQEGDWLENFIRGASSSVDAISSSMYHTDIQNV